MTTVAAVPLAPDPLFPQRDELVDEEALGARLSALLGEEIDACERVRATYHPGRSLRVLVRVKVGGQRRLVSARAFRPGASASRFERAQVSAGAGGVLHDECLGAVFFIFPADRKLAALPRLVDGSWPRVGGGPPSFRLVAYAPEKAATAAVLDPGGRTSMFLKLYSDETAARTRAVHLALRARGLRVPAVLAWWPELKGLALEPLGGRRLAALEGAGGWRALGTALGRLHRLEPVDARLSGRFEADALRAAATTIAALRPDLTAGAWTLERALRHAVPARSGRIACLHGDVQPKNVLVRDGAASLVDLDDVTGGDAHADLGSALGGLRYDGIVDRRDPRCAEALLEAYREEAGPPDADSVRWYTAAALLVERGLRSITRLRPEGLARLDAVLASGLEELG
jgi:tRNA A-37 threonylcarbamoyl transferase component Bud32